MQTVAFPYDSSLVEIRRQAAPSAIWHKAAKTWSMTGSEVETFLKTADTTLQGQHRAITVTVGGQARQIGSAQPPASTIKISRVSLGKFDGRVGATEWHQDRPYTVVAVRKYYVDEASSMGITDANGCMMDSAWMLQLTLAPVADAEAEVQMAKRRAQASELALDEAANRCSRALWELLEKPTLAKQQLTWPECGELAWIRVRQSRSTSYQFHFADSVAHWVADHLYDVDGYFDVQKDPRRAGLTGDTAILVEWAVLSFQAVQSRHGKADFDANQHFENFVSLYVALRRAYYSQGFEFDESREAATINRLRQL